MPEFNDVVRHVILRIVVDQAGLAEELAAARAKLKALKDSENDINRDRVKSATSVKDALEAQNKSLGENEQAHQAAQRARAGTPRDTEDVKQHTKAIRDDTAATKQQIVEEAKADSIRTKAHQSELDSIAKRSAAKKAAAAQVEQTLANAAKANEAASATRNNAINQRKLSRDESAAKIANQDYSTVSREDRADTKTQASTDRSDRTALANQLRQDVNAAAARMRADETAAATRTRLDANADNARRSASLKTTAAIERAEEESGQRIFNRQQSAEENLSTLRAGNEQKLTSQALLDAEKVATAQSRTRSVTEIGGARTDTAQSQAQIAAARALNTEDKTNFDIGERRVTAERNVERFKNDIAKVAAQTNLIEQRGLEVEERRARATERAANSRRGSILGGTTALIGNLVDVVKPLASSGLDNTRTNSGVKAFQETRKEAGSAREAVGSFFKAFRSGDAEVASVFDHLGARVKNFITQLKSASSGGGNLGSDIVGNLGDIANGFQKQLAGAGKHLFSFQSAIVAVIAALGPLAAILGAVGAAALGLASNVGALVGTFAALPGIIGAAVSAFGALAIVMGPVKSVFSAYSAAQKEATTTTNAATTAALALRDAQLQQQEAQLNVTRAQQDLPRSQTAYSDAVKDATRKIEDYRTALKRLKFDQEGASLGAESALQDYRRALADPTKSNLDRKIAAHAYQSALNDQADQATDAKRTTQDANEAISKGVQGSDEVIAAKRNEQDAVNNLKQAYIDLDKAKIAESKAGLEKSAGGTAAAALAAELAKLPPATRKVTEAILALIKGPYKTLREQLSEKIFGPISGDTGKFADILKSLGAFLTPAADAIGDFAKKALELFTDPDWKRFFSSQGDANKRILEGLGDAALSAATGFKNIVEVARPFTDFVVGGLKGMADAFERFTGSQKGRDQIATFLDTTKQRIKDLAPVLTNILEGIGGFFTALNTPDGGKKDFTSSFNDGLLTISKNFKMLGEDAANPNSGFRKWLANVLPLLADIGHFLGAAASAFGKLFSDKRNLKEAHDLLQNLATKWLPRLAEIFSQISSSGIISKLAKAIGGVFGAIQAFLDHGGLVGLSAFAGILGGIGTALDYLIKHVPILADVIGGLSLVIAGAFGAALLTPIAKAMVKVAQFAYKVTGLKALIGKIFGSNTAVPDAASTAATTATTTAAGAVEGAADEGAELTVLRRMEAYLRQIAVNTGGTGNVDLDDENTKDGKGSKNAAKNAVTDAETVAEDVAEGGAGAAAATKGNKVTRLLKKIFSKGGAATAVTAAEDVADVAAPAASTGGKALNFFKKLLPKGDSGSVGLDILSKTPVASDAGPSAVKAVAKATAKDAAETIAKDAATTTVKSTLSTAGKAFTGGLKGGLIAAAASVAAQVGGDVVIDHTVKNKDDKASVKNAVSTIASYASTGAILGNIIPIPGVGAAVGATAGGIAGGVKALATDKNLRNFVGGKVESGAKAVGNFFTDTIPNFLGKFDIGKSILGSLKKAGKGIGDFFTRDVPGFFHRGTKAITDFFTKTLPGLPRKAVQGFGFAIGEIIGLFEYKLPRAAAAAWKGITTFFTKTLPNVASAAWEGITGFFTVTLPNAASAAWHGITGFFTKTLPNAASAAWAGITGFFTKTLPTVAQSAWDGITNFFTVTLPKNFNTIVDSISTFFSDTLPNFFTKTLPDAIGQLPGMVKAAIVDPVVNFFTGLAGHVGDIVKGSWDWVKSVFSGFGKSVEAGKDSQKVHRMSGGLIEGIYQGIQDTVPVMATPGEFYVRKSIVDRPGAKAFLNDFNEGRFDPSSLYGGLSATTAPQVMSIVPPDARAMSQRVPSVVNNTVNHAPVMGDVTIHNPVRERSEHSLRRQVQIAAIRHRR